MRVRGRQWRRISGSLLLLTILILAAWPAAVGGQGSQPGDEMARLRQLRLRDPDSLPRYPEAGATVMADPQGLRLWETEDVIHAGLYGGYMSMVADPSGNLHVSYCDRTNYDAVLTYAVFDGSTWTTYPVETVGICGNTALALDEAGTPHIVYASAGALSYAYWNGTRWVTQSIIAYGVYDWDSMVLDAAGNPHISYEGGDANLMYSYYDGATWHFETVDGNGFGAGAQSSIALDGNGYPHISYADTTNSDLRYAYYDGENWHISVIDSTRRPIDTRIAVDGLGRPRILYSSGGVYYAYFDGANWQIELVDENGGGEWTPMVLDSQDEPHVAYGQMTGLSYASRGSAGWTIETAAGGGTPLYTSLVLAGGLPHLIHAHGDSDVVIRHTYAASASLVDWSKLAFASYRDMNYEIYAARGDGANATRLTWNLEVDSRPDFNRGGTQIVFDSRRDGNYEIYKMNADGSGVTRLTSTPYNEYLPSWSPDSAKIAYYAYPEGPDNAEIYVMNADGSGVTRLTSDTSWDAHPTWSPDGSLLAFASDRGVSPNMQIWIMGADGQSPHALPPVFSAAFYPDWSPEGTRLVFNDDTNGDGWLDLAVMDVDGTDLWHPVGPTPAYYDNLGPVWAPHGQDIAMAQIHYIYYRGNWYWTDAFIYGLDPGTGASYVLAGSSYDWWPSWRTTDITPPVSSVSSLLAWSPTTFTVHWPGDDSGGSGVHYYDVQYRDGESGPWTDWQTKTAQVTAAFSGQEGHIYYFRCRAYDYAFNNEPYPGGYDTMTGVDTLPPESSATSPAYASAPTFVVSWSGDDATSGIASYDVQYRDGSGSWANWLLETTATAASFTGQLGHTYYFQVQARDYAGNLEAYPGGNGDTQTQVPAYSLPGWVLGNREQPVAQALVESDPAALNTAYSGADGGFTLYANVTGTYALTVTRPGFGVQPPMLGVQLPGGAPTFYLPPADDRISGGDFEPGELAFWETSGSVTLTVPGHTGESSVQLGGPVPDPVVAPTSPFSAGAVLTDAGGVLTATWATVEVPAGAVSGTVVLSLTGVPTITMLPTTTQEVGLHVEVALALTDGTPVTGTVLPMTLTFAYEDAAWEAAQVEEGTLQLWRYDGASWSPLTSTVDITNNEVTVLTAESGLYALAGDPEVGPWASVLEQEVALTPTLEAGTLSLLYRVEGADPGSDTARVLLSDGTETLTYTLSLTETGWVHVWWGLESLTGTTLTVRLEYLQANRDATAGLLLDEVSAGSSGVGAYVVYLPVVFR